MTVLHDRDIKPATTTLPARGHPDLRPNLFVLQDEDATWHLLRVASGLDARQADLLHRCLDALAPEPLLLASGWGVARRWYRHATSPYAFFPAAHQRSLRPLPQALVRSALSTALGAALLTALYGARGCRYELRRGYLAESDAHQVAFSAALVSFDLSVVLATLRRALLMLQHMARTWWPWQESQVALLPPNHFVGQNSPILLDIVCALPLRRRCPAVSARCGPSRLNFMLIRAILMNLHPFLVQLKVRVDRRRKLLYTSVEA